MTNNWDSSLSLPQAKTALGCGRKDKPITEVGGVGYGCAARIIENGWKMDY